MNKPIYYFDIQQNTPEWFEKRKGKFTGSEFSTLFMKKDTKGYQNLIDRVAWEKAFGEAPDDNGFSSYYMERGKELEPAAIDYYRYLTFADTKRVGFVELSEYVGCSPDLLVEESGMAQIKCLKFTNHKEYLLTQKIDKKHLIQLQGELFVTQREWNDYFVFHPKLQSLPQRVYRDEKIIADIKTELDIAIEEVEKRLEQLKKLVR